MNEQNKKEKKEIDLSGVDEILSKEKNKDTNKESVEPPITPAIDLSGVDDILKKSSTPDRDLLQTIQDKAVGGAIGAGVGTGIGAVASPIGEYLEGKSDQWRFDQLKNVAPTKAKELLEESILREGKDFVTEKDLGKFAKEKGIGGKLGLYNTKKAAIKAQQATKSSGKQQGDYLKKLEQESLPISKNEIYNKMMSEYKKAGMGEIEADNAYAELSKKWSSDYNAEKQKQLLNRYQELKKYEADAKAFGVPIPESEIKEIKKIEDSLKNTVTTNEALNLRDIEKEKSSIPYEMDAESNLAEGRKLRADVLRATTEEQISKLPEGQQKLQQFRDLKKDTAKSKILSDLTMEGAKKDKGFFKQFPTDVMSMPGYLAKKTLGSTKNVLEPVLDVAGKGLKATGKIAPWAGAIIGGTMGAASAEEGGRLHGFGYGVQEAVNPVESLSNQELPKSQMAKDALEQEMKLKYELKTMPIEKKVQVVDALKGKMDYTPAEIQQVSEKLLNMQGGQEYANVLNQAAQMSDRSRKSVVFGLLQQPAFRELMKKIEGQE